MSVDYERETRLAYTNRTRADAYQARQTRSWTWSRVSTALERRVVKRMLDDVAGHGAATLLDTPCGTGVAAGVIAGLGFQVTGSDIAMAMMEHARPAYAGVTSRFVCADATQMPLADGAFDCILTLGFLHRLPPPIRCRAIGELARVSRRFVIVSCSLDSAAQQLKRALLRLTPGYKPAPSPVALSSLVAEFASAGLRVRSRVSIAPFASAESLFLLEKR